LEFSDTKKKRATVRKQTVDNCIGSALSKQIGFGKML